MSRRCSSNFARETVGVIDPASGEVRQAQIFVAVLGASSYTYAEACWSQDLASWIGAHCRACTFFGGVPRITVPDNPKAGGRHLSYYEPDVNPTYQEMAHHCGTIVIPTRPQGNRTKPKRRRPSCRWNAASWRRCATAFSSAWTS